ncbi:MAG: hypothetical protein ACRDQX_14555, partial [Pseudonocardiaceae bacterium]
LNQRTIVGVVFANVSGTLIIDRALSRGSCWWYLWRAVDQGTTGPDTLDTSQCLDISQRDAKTTARHVRRKPLPTAIQVPTPTPNPPPETRPSPSPPSPNPPHSHILCP